MFLAAVPAVLASTASAAAAVGTGVGTTLAAGAVATGGLIASSAGVAAGTVAAGAATASAASLFSTGAMIAAGVGGAVSAYGAYQQGQAQKNMMNYQAQAAAVQQQIVSQTATANITGVQDQASLASAQLARSQATIKGAQTAAMGAQGLDGSVTGADIAKDTFTKQQLDQTTLMYNANVKSWNITNQANSQLWGLGAQETQYSMGAENAAFAGDISAGGSLLSSAAQVGTIGVINSGMNPGFSQ